MQRGSPTLAGTTFKMLCQSAKRGEGFSHPKTITTNRHAARRREKGHRAVEDLGCVRGRIEVLLERLKRPKQRASRRAEGAN